MNTEMQQAVDLEQIRRVMGDWRRQALTTALVPTMGNLHEGHLALVSEARKHADRVVASIYVNPTQFGEGEDYDSYPRTPDTDRAALEEYGCDLLFAPGHDTIYPPGITNSIRLVASPDLAAPLEGECRPGHFDGVLTVVARLFNLVVPDVAVFGEKDFQQLLLIRRMVEDLSFDVRIVSVPTVREPNGLAMSSRNRYLRQEDREAAVQLSSVLSDVVEQVRNHPASWKQAEEGAMRHLETLGFRVDYVAVRRADSLAAPSEEGAQMRVLAAVHCGQTRLIDNMKII
jgi:pantoate--beta-alanine ligase